MKRFWTHAGRGLRVVAMFAGGVFVFLVFLCATPLPWRMYHWLSMPEAVLDGKPEWIVVLGGGGIPSESGLMRTYYGAAAARQHPGARIIVALPGLVEEQGNALYLMRKELLMRGVAPERIVVEPRGINTHAQAVEVFHLLGGAAAEARLLIVTSPEHMRRAVRAFQRAGFVYTGSQAALDTGIQHDLAWEADYLQPERRVHRVESHLFVRYRFWHGVTYLTRSAREGVALLYYRAKGWI